MAGASKPGGNPIFKSIDHIGIVVRDVEKTAANYADKFGIGPWTFYVCGPDNILDMKIKEKKSQYSFKIALVYLGETGIELIQPLDDRSIYADFLEKHGENLHHIGYIVEDYDKALDFFENKKIKQLMSGNFFGHNKYTYLDTQSELKHIVSITKSDSDFFTFKENRFGIKKITHPLPSMVYPGQTIDELEIKPVFRRIGQVAFVVDDVDRMADTCVSGYSILPWRIWEFGPETVYNMTVDGKRQDYSMRLGISKIGSIDFEIIQPRDEKSIYHSYRNANGEGFHHLAYELEDYSMTMDYLEKLSVKVSMSGVWFGKHTWVYMATEKYLKHIAELNYTEPGFQYPAPLKYIG